MGGVEQISFDGGRIRIDETRREVWCDGQRLDVQGRRFDLLVALVQRRDRLAGRSELIQAVWPGRVVVDNNLEVHVAALRAAFGRDAIATQRGLGYRWMLVPDGAAATAGLPASGLGPLFGRDGWLDEAARWLAPGAPAVVTLHGAGGAGKSRLAAALAARHRGAYADGHCEVRLAPVRQAAQVPYAVAAALGLQPFGSRPMAAQVEAFLKERQLLLELDNAEHLLPELTPLLQRWCAAAPRLKLLLTSRRPLGIDGERVLVVPPLATPEGDGDAALASPALQLLRSRARTLGHDFAGEPAELAAAAELCRRLAGLPLALELAAARLRVLSPRALLARFAEPLPLLAGGPAVEPRQRSLADTVAWSVALLPASAQRLFAQLGVFVDGCTLDAARDVGGLDTATALHALDELLEVFLVQRSDGADGEPRYRMLEPVREVALQRLADDGGAAAARARHVEWYAGFADAAAPQLGSGARAAALARLEPERANLAAALRHLVHERADARAALQLSASLAWAWYFGGALLEGRQWLRQALELPGADAHAAERVRALIGAARLSMYLFDIDDALAQADAALAGARALGELRLQAEALFVRAVPTLGRDPAGAAAFFRESRALFEAAGDAWGVALATSYLGIPYSMRPGQEAEAEALLAEGRRRFAELGDDWGMNVHDHYGSLIALRRGDLARARELSQRTLDTARALDDGFRVAGVLQQLSRIERAAGDAALAMQRLHECAALHQAQGRAAYAGLLLRQGARWLVEAGGDEHRAAALFGAAGVDRGPVLPIWITPDEARAAADAEAALRARMPADAFERAWREGQSWSTAQAVAALHPR